MNTLKALSYQDKAAPYSYYSVKCIIKSIMKVYFFLYNYLPPHTFYGILTNCPDFGYLQRKAGSIIL